MRSLCTICSTPIVARGFCKQHYRAFMRYGDPLARNNLRGVPFQQRYSLDPRTQCWLWIGAVDTSGYGIGKFANEARAHRASWAIKHGPIPSGLQVLHKCDTPACVNPKHLFLGTHQDNMADLRVKGRAYGAAGEANSGAKITEADAMKIMADHRSITVIAAEYGIDRISVDSIRNGRTWKHLFDPAIKAERKLHGPRHLTDAEKKAIFKDARRQIDIAAEYGVSQTRISLIKRGPCP